MTRPYLCLRQLLHVEVHQRSEVQVLAYAAFVGAHDRLDNFGLFVFLQLLAFARRGGLIAEPVFGVCASDELELLLQLLEHEQVEVRLCLHQGVQFFLGRIASAGDCTVDKR